MTTSSSRAAKSRQERRRWRRKQRPRQHAPVPPHLFGVGDQVELEEVVEQRARKLSARAEVGNTAAAHGNAAAPAEQHAQGRTRECPTGSRLVSSGGDVTWIFGIRNQRAYVLNVKSSCHSSGTRNEQCEIPNLMCFSHFVANLLFSRFWWSTAPRAPARTSHGNRRCRLAPLRTRCPQNAPLLILGMPSWHHRRRLGGQ